MANKFQIPPPHIPTVRKAFVIGRDQILGRVKAKVFSSNFGTQESDEPVDTSAYLGTPVYSQFVLKRDINTTVGQEHSGDGYCKFESAIGIINQQRNIERTVIQGRNGTVKEYISDGDFEISIRGRVIGKFPNQAPKEEMQNIIALLKEPNELVIISDFVALFGIQYVVGVSYNFRQVEGSINEYEFSLELYSDDPIELKLGIDPDA